MSDTGVGIRPELLPYLFEKGRETSTLGTEGELGTGLGLPLRRDIMEAHGGARAVSSTPGAGSSFTLTLPERSGGLERADA